MIKLFVALKIFPAVGEEFCSIPPLCRDKGFVQELNICSSSYNPITAQTMSQIGASTLRSLGKGGRGEGIQITFYFYKVLMSLMLELI